jgi:hypothetical protein
VRLVGRRGGSLAARRSKHWPIYAIGGNDRNITHSMLWSRTRVVLNVPWSFSLIQSKEQLPWSLSAHHYWTLAGYFHGWHLLLEAFRTDLRYEGDILDSDVLHGPHRLWISSEIGKPWSPFLATKATSTHLFR